MESLIINIVRKARNNPIFSNFLNLSSIQVSNVVLLILLHPILNRKIGDAYGITMVANSFAILIGIIVNYGTNQSGIKDIALVKENKEQTAIEFYNVLLLRALIFIPAFIILLLAGTLEIKNYSFFLLATPLIFTEVLNPLVLFIAMERLSIFNMINVLIKAGIILSVIFFINGPEDARWVNFYIGIIHITGYAVLIVYAIYKFGLQFKKFNHLNYSVLLKSNFYLVGNGLSAHLQQSFLLFALARWGSSNWLFAYSLCDKIIWSARVLIISVANAIYPKAAIIYNESHRAFQNMKLRYNRFFSICFGALFLILLLGAPSIIRLYTGGENELAILFLRLMSLSPLLAALNALNIIHLLISNQNKQLLNIGVLLLFTSFCFTSIAIYSMNYYMVGIYAVIMEGAALGYYSYVLKDDKTTLIV